MDRYIILSEFIEFDSERQFHLGYEFTNIKRDYLNQENEERYISGKYLHKTKDNKSHFVIHPPRRKWPCSYPRESILVFAVNLIKDNKIITQVESTPFTIKSARQLIQSVPESSSTRLHSVIEQQQLQHKQSGGAHQTTTTTDRTITRSSSIENEIKKPKIMNIPSSPLSSGFGVDSTQHSFIASLLPTPPPPPPSNISTRSLLQFPYPSSGAHPGMMVPNNMYHHYSTSVPIPPNYFQGLNLQQQQLPTSYFLPPNTTNTTNITSDPRFLQPSSSFLYPPQQQQQQQQQQFVTLSHHHEQNTNKLDNNNNQFNVQYPSLTQTMMTPSFQLNNHQSVVGNHDDDNNNTNVDHNNKTTMNPKNDKHATEQKREE